MYVFDLVIRTPLGEVDPVAIGLGMFISGFRAQDQEPTGAKALCKCSVMYEGVEHRDAVLAESKTEDGESRRVCSGCECQWEL